MGENKSLELAILIGLLYLMEVIGRKSALIIITVLVLLDFVDILIGEIKEKKKKEKQ